jgi:lysophospholipase L1-like esterase
MILRHICLLYVLCYFAVLDTGVRAAQEQQQNPWEETIKFFEEWDRKNSYPSDAVLFVGSSSIRMWPTCECFEEFDVINRGFGGSQISDVNYFAERIVLRYEPKVIVFYAGDNDVAGGKSALRVFEDYKKFTNLVQKELPGIQIIFISIKPSQSRWSVWPVMNEANMLIKDFSDKDDRLFYFDGATPLLTEDGKPNSGLFLEDNLHLNSKGYELWARLLKPVIRARLTSNEKEN